MQLQLKPMRVLSMKNINCIKRFKKGFFAKSNQKTLFPPFSSTINENNDHNKAKKYTKFSLRSIQNGIKRREPSKPEDEEENESESGGSVFNKYTDWIEMNEMQLKIECKKYNIPPTSSAQNNFMLLLKHARKLEEGEKDHSAKQAEEMPKPPKRVFNLDPQESPFPSQPYPLEEASKTENIDLGRQTYSFLDSLSTRNKHIDNDERNKIVNLFSSKNQFAFSFTYDGKEGKEGKDWNEEVRELMQKYECRNMNISQ
jgi:hypothetical protein